jgi:hypothetical protein
LGCFEEALSLCHAILAFHSNAKRETSENLPRCFKTGSYFQCVQIESFHLQCKLSLLNFLVHEESLFLELMLHHHHLPGMIVALTRLRDNYPDDPHPNSAEGEHYTFVPESAMMDAEVKESKRKHMFQRLKLQRWLFRSLCQIFPLSAEQKEVEDGRPAIEDLNESQIAVRPELHSLLKSSLHLARAQALDEVEVAAAIEGWLQSLSTMKEFIRANLNSSSFSEAMPSISDLLLLWMSWIACVFEQSDHLAANERLTTAYIDFLRYLHLHVLEEMRVRVASEELAQDVSLDETLVAYANEAIDVASMLRESFLLSVDRMSAVVKKKLEAVAKYDTSNTVN